MNKYDFKFFFLIKIRKLKKVKIINFFNLQNMEIYHLWGENIFIIKVSRGIEPLIWILTVFRNNHYAMIPKAYIKYIGGWNCNLIILMNKEFCEKYKIDMNIPMF